MELSKKAIEFAIACRDGDIIEGKPVQLEMLARNAQALIDEYELILMRHAERSNKVDAAMMRKDARIAEMETERHYLRWFHANADFGPAEADVIMAMQAEYAKERPVPATWLYE